MKKIRLFFIFILLTAGSGCRTLYAPSDYNRSWTSYAGERFLKSPDTAGISLRELKIDSSKPLDLIKLVDISLLNSPVTKKAWENARKSEALKKQAESPYYPQVTINAQATRYKKNASRTAENLNQWNLNPALSISYLLFDFGGRNAALEQAYEQLLSDNFQFNQSIQDLLLNVGTSYYTLYSSYELEKSAETDVKNAEATLISAKEKLSVGLGTELEVLQAKSNYFDKLYSLENAKNNVKTAKANLAKTIGVLADTDFDISPPARDVPTHITREHIKELIAKALVDRPDIASSRAQLKAKEFAVTVANSTLFPVLNLGADAGKNWYRIYDADRENEDDYEYSGFLTLEWDAFSGFYNYNAKIAAKREKDAAYESLVQAELDASADVWNKYYGFKTAIRKYKFSKAFLDAAKESNALALESYAAGLKSILDVLQAQSDFSSASSKLIQSRKDLFIALIQLAHSTGSLNTQIIEKED